MNLSSLRRAQQPPADSEAQQDYENAGCFYLATLRQSIGLIQLSNQLLRDSSALDTGCCAELALAGAPTIEK